MSGEAKNERLPLQKLGQHEGLREDISVLETSYSSTTGQHLPKLTNDRNLIPRPPKRRRCKSTSGVSLDAPRLPMRSQHRLLAKLQDLIEHACYNFTHTIIPELLQEKGWDYLECVELNLWPQFLLRYKHKFSSERLLALGKPLRAVLGSMSELRHTVIHRTRIPATKVKHFLLEAETIKKLLSSVHSDMSVLQLNRTTLPVLEEFIQTTGLLASSLAEEKAAITIAQAQLDRREETVITEINKKGMEQEAAAGSALEDAINSMEPS